MSHSEDNIRQGGIGKYSLLVRVGDHVVSFKYDTKENDDALEQSLVIRAPPDEVGGTL